MIPALITDKILLIDDVILLLFIITPVVIFVKTIIMFVFLGIVVTRRLQLLGSFVFVFAFAFSVWLPDTLGLHLGLKILTDCCEVDLCQSPQETSWERMAGR